MEIRGAEQLKMFYVIILVIHTEMYFLESIGKYYEEIYIKM